MADQGQELLPNDQTKGEPKRTKSFNSHIPPRMLGQSHLLNKIFHIVLFCMVWSILTTSLSMIQIAGFHYFFVATLQNGSNIDFKSRFSE